MKEEYQPKSEASGAEWQSLAEMPDFATHEAMQSQEAPEAPAVEASEAPVPELEPSDDLVREIGSVVDAALKERAEHGVATTTESELESTQELNCDILDQDWAPEFDRRYWRDISKQEQYERNQRDLAELNQFLQLPPEQREQYLSVHQTLFDSMQDDIRQRRARAAELNVPPEEIDGYNQLYELACDRRRDLQLLKDPEWRRKSLASQQVRLGRELAQDNPLYHDALEGMDAEIVDQNISAILESVPPKDFDKLAKLMDRQDKWPAFQKQVQEVLVRALNLEDTNIQVEMVMLDNDGRHGDCTPTEDGYRVRLNAASIGQDTWAYAQTLAHELYHVMQGRVMTAGGTEMSDLYNFNLQHYGRPDQIGYQSYKNQLNEAEAFRFMDRFLGEIRAGDVRNRNTLAGRIRHWWEERDTEKLPESDSHKDSQNP